MLNGPVPPPHEESDSPIKNGINTENKKEGSQKRPILFVKGSGDNNGQLVIATYILGVATLALAYFAFDQAGSIRSTFHEQRHYDSVQLAFARTTDSIHNIRDSVRDTRDSIHTRATLDSTGIQLGLSREAMQRQLRAYVYVSTDHNALPQKDVLANFLLNNSGLTPAYSLTWRKIVQWAAFPLREKLSTLDSISVDTAIVNPGLKAPWEVRYPKWWPGSYFQQMEWIRGEMALYIFGEINYMDAFNIPRYVKFCFVARGNHPGGIYLYKTGNNAN